MNTHNNKLRQETDDKLQNVLLEYIKQDREPTVGQICESAGINRSTFYRHYKDVIDLMEQTEARLQQGLASILTGKVQNSEGLLERMLAYIREYKSFYRVYLKKQSGSPFEAGFENVWEQSLKPRFQKEGVFDEHRMMYYYQFVRAGVTQILKLWIDSDCAESPEEIGGIIRAMLISNYRKGETK